MQAKNELGKRYGRLAVVARHRCDNTHAAKWECLCDCGERIVANGADLRSGGTSSCGCLWREMLSINKITHGKSETRTYKIWLGVKNRCLNPNASSFKDYGARGITICERWSDGDGAFENFLDDMGERPSSRHSIDRIDNEGPYSPENCRWATADQQNSNRRSNRLYTHDGRTQTLTAWAAELGINKSTAFTRIRKGMSFKAAMGLSSDE